MKKENIFKFISLVIVFVVGIVSMWYFGFGKINAGGISINDLSKLDKNYFEERIGTKLALLKRANYDLTDNDIIRAFVAHDLLLNKEISEQEIKQYVKENFGINDYSMETGEFTFPCGPSYTVTKIGDTYSAFYGFGYEGENYEFKNIVVDKDTIVVNYEYLESLEISSPEKILVGEFNVHFKLVNGYLNYQKIVFEEYLNPKKIVDLTDNYIIDYLK
jgi:hypothetical protein